MAEFRKVTEDFSVAAQIELADVAQVEAAARAAGLDYAHIPVRGGPTPEQVEQENALIAEAPGPILAFCRSGTRSIVTWSLGQTSSGERSRQDLINLGAKAGYDLSGALGA